MLYIYIDVYIYKFSLEIIHNTNFMLTSEHFIFFLKHVSYQTCSSCFRLGKVIRKLKKHSFMNHSSVYSYTKRNPIKIYSKN